VSSEAAFLLDQRGDRAPLGSRGEKMPRSGLIFPRKPMADAKGREAYEISGLGAARFNPILSAFYQKLIANGKLPKVALTAVMRKLLIYMNHKLKSPAAALSATQVEN
jgi:hypothetical protein